MFDSSEGTDDKPSLVIRPDDLTVTARDLARIIAESGCAFDRAGPVQVFEQPNGPPRVVRLTPDSVVLLAHTLARPATANSDGKPTAKTLPHRVANLYLALNDWGLRPLKGVTTAPLLSDSGAIRAAAGYDPESCLWCVPPPDLIVPGTPSQDDARAALARLRAHFRTFAFADATTADLVGLRCIAPAIPPGQDESAFLAALLTAICRPSLPLAPGLLIGAPAITGAGTGKGNLVRAIAQIAYGIEPRAFTAGRDTTELDKRIASALIEANSVLFIDNANGECIRSDLLASVLTERCVEVRPLGFSRMLPLWPCAFVAITGNGVSISEDLARRFLVVNLDARMEDPEARRFPPGFLNRTAAGRAALLAAGLTIWRWGRQNAAALHQGRPLGSFEDWCAWVRDPLLTLGCADPVERVAQIKASDPARRALAQLFAAWWEAHGSAPVKAANLAESVRDLIDPQGRGSQFIASFLTKHTGTCAAGYVLKAQRPPGKWGTTTYALHPINDTG